MYQRTASKCALIYRKWYQLSHFQQNGSVIGISHMEKRTVVKTVVQNTPCSYYIVCHKTYLYCFITPLRWLLPIDALHQAFACILQVNTDYSHFHIELIPNVFNPLWNIDAISCSITWSTLVQVMVYCLTASNHYMNQCWLIVRDVLRHWFEDNFGGNAQVIHRWYECENY